MLHRRSYAPVPIMAPNPGPTAMHVTLITELRLPAMHPPTPLASLPTLAPTSRSPTSRSSDRSQQVDSLHRFCHPAPRLPQANLGLRRVKPCEECLALAQLLLMREPEAASHLMHSQLARLYGQLYAYQVRACDSHGSGVGVQCLMAVV
jgi:hypothetical protein